jgi:hypothetical protein
MPTKIVFDSTSSEARWILWSWPVVLAAVLVVLSALWVAVINWKRGLRLRTFGIGLTLLLILTVWFRYSYYHWIFFTQYLDSGPYQSVEGPVENYLATPGKVVNFEQFTVNGVRLGYGSLGMPKCFSHPAANGGPIREGLPVRITYHGNCIVKLEILQGAPAK